jgi:hypothetical protein
MEITTKKNQFIHLIVNGKKNCMLERLEMKYLLQNYRENQKKSGTEQTSSEIYFCDLNFPQICRIIA